ncbi:MAG: ABC transporter permease [Blastocatellia bacterium]
MSVPANPQSAIRNPQSIGPQSAGPQWGFWLHQIMAIIRLELGKTLWGKRSLLLYLGAAGPILLMALLVMNDRGARRDIQQNFGDAQQMFGLLYEGLLLRSVVFFGCAWLFMNLFRGEIVDKSLHYYFLSPVRRGTLLTGKYIAGLITAWVLMIGSTAGTLFFFYTPRGWSGALQQLFEDGGLGVAMTYLAMTALACAGYGAVFLVIGLFFRNPIIPALAVYGWEWLNFLLPPGLKKLSVIHYVHSLQPVPVDDGPLAIIGEATPAWIAVPGMLLFTALVLWLASQRIRRVEISYGGE